MRILVTAGPTREPLDPVRFLSNRSSVKMVYAVAAAAADRGHEVELVSGPVHLDPPDGTRITRVQTAQQMLESVLELLPGSDALVMCAAVADWRPARYSADKLKKGDDLSALALERTCDILESVRGMKGERIVVGFAAETGDPAPEARRKLEAKQLDLVVGNDISQHDAGFETDTNRVVLVSISAPDRRLGLLTKREVAEHILDWIQQRAAGRSG